MRPFVKGFRRTVPLKTEFSQQTVIEDVGLVCVPQQKKKGAKSSASTGSNAGYPNKPSGNVARVCVLKKEKEISPYEADLTIASH